MDTATAKLLDGRVVIVAGAGGGGIGTSILERVLSNGGTALAVDVSDSALEKTMIGVERFSDRCVPVLADVAEPDGIEQIMSAADKVGELYGLVSVVGGAYPAHWSSFMDSDDAQWEQVFRLNLSYLPSLTHASVTRIERSGNGGSIVFVSSVSGMGCAPYHASYGAAKAGVVSLCRTIAVELGHIGIRANVVAPGSIATPRTVPGSADEERDSAIPLRRQGLALEIANCALFLLSDWASYVTGQVLMVDGGASLKPAYLNDHDLPKFLTDASILERLGLGPNGTRG